MKNIINKTNLKKNIFKCFSNDDIEKIISSNYGKLVDIQEKAFIEFHKKQIQVPTRLVFSCNEGPTLVKPAYHNKEETFACKIVSIRNKNAEINESTVPATNILMDAITGLPLSIMDGTILTGLRTAAGSAVTTKYLSNKNSKTLAIYGTGLQGRLHIDFMLAVRPSINKIYLWNRSEGRSKSVKEEYEKKYGGVEFIITTNSYIPLKDSDIIVTATSSNVPLFDGKLVKKGAHVNCVGSFQKENREVDGQLISRSKCIVDTLEAESTSGEFHLAKEEGFILKNKTHSLFELGHFLVDLPSSLTFVRSSDDDITLFKSVGHALQDLAICQFVQKIGSEMNLGTNIDFQNPNKSNL